MASSVCQITNPALLKSFNGKKPSGIDFNNFGWLNHMNSLLYFWLLLFLPPPSSQSVSLFHGCQDRWHGENRDGWSPFWIPAASLSLHPCAMTWVWAGAWGSSTSLTYHVHTAVCMHAQMFALLKIPNIFSASEYKKEMAQRESDQCFLFSPTYCL